MARTCPTNSRIGSGRWHPTRTMDRSIQKVRMMARNACHSGIQVMPSPVTQVHYSQGETCLRHRLEANKWLKQWLCHCNLPVLRKHYF